MTKVKSWGYYPPYPQTPHTCYWRSDLPRLLSNSSGILPFGNGRSYGDSCLAVSDQVLHTRLLDRFIEVDWEKGIIIVEAGVLLDEILRIAIPKGWFLPVTPGTKFVTLGGAVANDVHGKNHHKQGTFGRFVRRFSLVRSDQTTKICSKEENTDLFVATIGGLGLTGIVEWVELQLIPIQSSFIDAIHIRFDSINEFFVLSRELDDKYEYTVSWIDCLAKNGRGVFLSGNHADKGGLQYANKKELNVPLTPPFSAINPLSLRLFNSAYYHSYNSGRKQSIVNYEPFFYPLDRILNWNRIYGPKGFQQYQCALPNNTTEPAIKELLSIIASSGSGSFLAVLKRFGNIPSPGLLSFPLPGLTLALDFPVEEKLKGLFERLDWVVREAKGRLYPAKDAHMSAEDFQAFYPAWKQVESLRDPAICSRFWKRVTQ